MDNNDIMKLNIELTELKRVLKGEKPAQSYAEKVENDKKAQEEFHKHMLDKNYVFKL